ncbi:hypothetical protein Bca52824_002631 [Brassica carinata]|uniref:Uncharacterized protein n=1 Tax=Brassica carinata TaxID=52824 RepID=A0A8X7WKM6_BRACI|nr:hypothetical protein Bca52824_002631 [Brassica carinata]
MCMSRNGRMASDLSRAVPVERDIEQEEYERSIAAIEAEADDEELYSGEAKQTMFTEDFNMSEMYNPIPPFGERCDGVECSKRKTWLNSATDNVAKFTNMEPGETSELH